MFRVQRKHKKGKSKRKQMCGVGLQGCPPMARQINLMSADDIWSSLDLGGPFALNLVQTSTNRGWMQPPQYRLCSPRVS